jgi:hypothetical protein
LSHKLSEEPAAAASSDAPKTPALIAGFSSTEQSMPMNSCNNLIGLDGELLQSFSNLRKSHPAHININMWVLNIFAEKDKPETLLKSIDVHNVDLKFEQYKHAN